MILKVTNLDKYHKPSIDYDVMSHFFFFRFKIHVFAAHVVTLTEFVRANGYTNRSDRVYNCKQRNLLSDGICNKRKFSLQREMVNELNLIQTDVYKRRTFDSASFESSHT